MQSIEGKLSILARYTSKRLATLDFRCMIEPPVRWRQRIRWISNKPGHEALRKRLGSKQDHPGILVSPGAVSTDVPHIVAAKILGSTEYIGIVPILCDPTAIAS